MRVLKAVNLLNDKNEPTELYSRFMNLDEGAKVLGPEIKRIHAPLFQASHTPYAETNEKLQNLFNIHSGGGDRALDSRSKRLRLFADAAFDPSSIVSGAGAVGVSAQGGDAANSAGGSESGLKPVININFHVTSRKTNLAATTRHY